MKNYDTMVEALSGLKARGYTLDFNLTETRLECPGEGLKLDPQEFEISEVHRFEGDSNPADMSVVYAIESNQGHKGSLVAAFGTYADTVSAELLSKLSVHH